MSVWLSYVAIDLINNGYKGPQIDHPLCGVARHEHPFVLPTLCSDGGWASQGKSREVGCLGSLCPSWRAYS